MTPLWPIQERGIAGVMAAVAAGHTRVLLTAPTGTGKSRSVCELIEWYAGQGWHAVLYSNRKLLIDQLSAVLDAHGIAHGVRAADHPDERQRPVQIASLQTEGSRTLKAEEWKVHGANRQCLVVIDEAHCNAGPTAREMMQRHRGFGHVILGVTATPIGLGDLYDHLLVAGTNSDGRACGALVPALHYGPDEPDLRSIGRVALGEDLSEPQNVKAIMTPTIFGRVLEWYRKLNPGQKPTILFAPGVAESLWFAEQFEREGISAAHIDGKEVWVRGNVATTSRAAREDVLEGSRDGRIRVLCNRFVLREGIDAPWLAHGIFATVFGSLQSYLQSGGRLLRSHPGGDRVTVQDHGGNWWRHGSLNADREWALDMTPAMVAGLREERLREKRQQEPCRCPACGMILAGTKCPCGFVVDLTKKSRPVIQADGTIKMHHGDVYKPRRREQRADTQDLWKKVYYRAHKSKMTFRQAEGLFVVENGYYPPHDLHYMPREPVRWFWLVKDVPTGDLL